MPRSRLLLIGALVAVAAAATAAPPGASGPAAMAVAGVPVVVGTAPPDVPDPFPTVRLRVTDAQLPDAAKAFAPGPLVRLPRAAFEEKVRAAGAAVLAAKSVPRIVAARYTAAPSGTALAGTAEWTIAHAGRGPAVLPLDPLKLALREPVWADGSPAAVGAFVELPAGGAGVWVPGPGRQVLKAKWTAAGTGPAAERTFDLRVPACPASALELDLPDDRTPAAGGDVLVAGPLPGAPAGRRRWQLRFGEKARVDLAVRGPADTGGAGPVVFASAARYDLSAAEAACEIDLDVRATRGSAAEWAFVLGPGLRVTDVTVNNRAGWRIDPATKELRVSLRQPAAAAKVRVTAAAPLPAGPGTPVPLPTIRPVNGLPTDERAEVHLAPGLDLAAWDAGDYRLVDATADSGRVLSLIGTLLPAGSTAVARCPPAVRVAAGGPVFATTETVAWRVEAGRAHLSARIGVKVRRGPLFRVAVRPPAGFELVRTAATPADGLAFTALGAAGAVVVELARPLTAGQEAELVLDFRGPPVPPGPVVRLPFPTVGVAGAAERDGAVTLAPGPGWEAYPHVLPETADLPPDDTPDGTAVVRFRGREPSGELVLSAVRPRFAASVETRFDFTNGRLTATSVVRLDVSAGLVGGVAVSDPAGVDAGRTWKVTDGSNTVAAAAPAKLGGLPAALPLLGQAGSGLAPLVATAAAHRQEPGTLWLVRLARPVEDEVTLETTAVLGTGLTHADAAQRAARWGGPVACGAAASTVRTELPAALGGAEPAGPADAPPTGWALADLSLTTACGEYDQHATFRGRVAARGARELPVGLPPGTTAESARVGGKAVDPVALAGDELFLPIPDGDEAVAFEVHYRLPRTPQGVGWSVVSPEPAAPGAGPVRREWVFGPGASAAWPLAVGADYRGEAVTVVPDRYAAAAGVALAALAGGLGWLGVRAASRAAGVALLVALAGAGAAVSAGPAAWARAGWPVLVVGLPAAAAVVVAQGRLPRRTGAAGVVLAAAVGAGAQPGATDVVFVLTGTTGEVVLAPPVLLDRLDALTKPAAPAPVVVAAAYDGRVEDGLARVTAAFTVQAFGAGEQAVQLPLADVRLERVTVNGRPANPATGGAGKYAVPLPGPGRHAVEVRFAAPVSGTGAEREVKFGVPEVPDARLAFAAPPAGRQVQATGRFGEQKAGADPARIDADLGAVRGLAVRWREGPGGAGTLTVREGCVWDVSEAGAVLTACYDIRAESGTAAGFRFDLPPGLEPVRVAARGLDPLAAPVAVQSWTVDAEKNGLRPLRVTLAAPADGRVLVTIECHTPAVPTRQPVLRFPRPVGMTRLGGVYGLRAAGVAVEAVGRTGVIDFAPDVLVREFGAVSELRLVPGVAVQAFSPRLGESAELRPTLRPAADPGTARVEATWAADLRGAAGTGTVTWSAETPAALLEFALAARVREVRGAEVAGWAQAGERVQVWLRRPATAATVAWAADLTHGAKGADVVAFAPPVPRPVGAAPATAVVRVRPADGIGFKVEHDAKWTADAPGAAREWAFRGAGAIDPPRVQLAASRVGAATGFGLLDLGEREPTYRVAVDLLASAGRPVHAVVRVTGLPPGATAALEPPAGTRATLREADDDTAAWNLDAAGPVRAAVVVRLPGRWAGPLPVVWVGAGGDAPTGAGVVRFIGQIGRPDVRLNGTTGSSPVELAQAGAVWPGEVERLRRTGGMLRAVEDGPVEAVPPAPVVTEAPRPPPVMSASVAPAVPADVPTHGVVEAAGWGLTLLAVGVLLVRFPRATWPEQAAVLAGLFGQAVAAAPTVGLAVYVAARGVWVADRLRGGRVS